MAFHLDLNKEARASYRQGRYDEAALVFRRAAAAALDIGNQAAWFEYTVWAALAKTEQGDLLAAMRLLLEARSQEPNDAPQYEAWLARKGQFEITFACAPELPRLQLLLQELQNYGARNHVPAADIECVEAELLLARGFWAKSLVCSESAWTKHDGKGTVKYGIACCAMAAATRLGHTAVAHEWLVVLQGCGNDNFSDKAFRNAEENLKLALAEKGSFATVEPLLRTLADHAISLQVNSITDRLRELSTRVHLLDALAGDPCSRHHPARSTLRQRPANRNSVFDRYAARLLVLDYRLAALRFVVGIPPVDDLYYSCPQQTSLPAPPKQIALIRKRLAKAHAAASWVRIYARHLDDVLECDWRQREIQARCTRINDIAKAALPDTFPHGVA